MFCEDNVSSRSATELSDITIYFFYANDIYMYMYVYVMRSMYVTTSDIPNLCVRPIYYLFL